MLRYVAKVSQGVLLKAKGLHKINFAKFNINLWMKA